MHESSRRLCPVLLLTGAFAGQWTQRAAQLATPAPSKCRCAAPGKFLAAFSRRFATEPGPSAQQVSEFSACRQILPLPPLIFDNGFE